MKNERGFFTIVGLCLLLVAAISIKGIHEFETNHSNGINEALIENTLQNIADNALMAKIMESNYIPTDDGRLKNLKIETPEPQELTFGQFIRNYSGSTYDDVPVQIKIGDKYEDKEITAKIYMSVASCDSPYIQGKIYRYSLAYILEDTIHFMNDAPK